MRNSLHWAKLLNLIRQRSFTHGDVLLSSGAHSNYYVDGKMVTLSPEGAWLTAQLILELLQKEDLHPDAIGGLAIGADPIAAFIVRRERKGHGKQKWIEGPLASGSDVVVVDDVVTRGASVRRAIKAAENLGCRVIKVIALVDRLEGAAETLKAYDFTPIFTREDLMKTDERTREEATTGTLC